MSQSCLVYTHIITLDYSYITKLTVKMLLIKISEEGVTILKHKSDMFPWQQKFDDDDSDSDMNDNNEDLENTQRFVNVLLFSLPDCHRLHLLAFCISIFFLDTKIMFHAFFIQVFFLTTGKAVPGLVRAMEKTMNLSLILIKN